MSDYLYQYKTRQEEYKVRKHKSRLISCISRLFCRHEYDWYPIRIGSYTHFETLCVKCGKAKVE